MPFKGNYDIRKISPMEYMMLAEYSYTDPLGREHVVPRGMKTDGKSIPPFLWGIIGSPFTGRSSKASGVHDMLHKIQTLTRKDTDKVFLWAAKEEGEGRIKRRIMWRFVRMFSWIPWNNQKRKLKKHGIDSHTQMLLDSQPK